MYNVMIVDDVEVMRLQIKRLPVWGDEYGFQIVSEAGDGQEALDHLDKQPVDLIITDIKMPKVDGLELLKEVYEKYPDINVVFLSDHTEFSIAKEAIRYGVTDYLVKPVSQEALCDLLRKARLQLDERTRVKKMLVNLEEKLQEKLEIFYPKDNIILIGGLIAKGDTKALAELKIMADELLIAVDNDEIKAALILKKAYRDIIEFIINEYPWLDLFESINNDDDFMKIATKLIQLFGYFLLNFESDTYVGKLIRYVIDNVEGDVSMKTIANNLYLSKNYIGEIFKDETGITVREYVARIKVARAKKLIDDGSLKWYEIATRLGYNNLEYFTKVFKKTSGFSPLEYRRSLM